VEKYRSERKNTKKEMNSEWKKYNDGPFVKRFDHSIVSVGSTIYLFGGMSEGWKWVNDFWSFDVKKNEWLELKTEGGPVPVKDHSFAIDEEEKKMYIFGGKTEGKRSLNHLWIFEFDTKKWTTVEGDDNGPCKRYGGTTVVREKKLYLFGGKRHTKDPQGLDDLWEFDTDTHKWSLIDAKSKEKPDGLIYHTAVIYKNEMIVTAGYKEKKPTTEQWSLNLDSLEWKKLEDAPFAPRSGHCAALKGEKLLVFGGEGANDEGITCENDLWEFDIVSQKWKEIKALNGPDKRLGVKGTFIGDQFFIVGGIKVSKEWNPEAWFNDVWAF